MCQITSADPHPLPHALPQSHTRFRTAVVTPHSSCHTDPKAELEGGGVRPWARAVVGSAQQNARGGVRRRGSVRHGSPGRATDRASAAPRMGLEAAGWRAGMAAAPFPSQDQNGGCRLPRCQPDATDSTKRGSMPAPNHMVLGHNPHSVTPIRRALSPQHPWYPGR